MRKLNEITELIDDMIEERANRGICDDQSEILKNGVEFSSDVEFFFKLNSYYQKFRNCFDKCLYDEMSNYENTVLFYHPEVYNLNNKYNCSDIDNEYIKRSIVEKNSLDVIRRFFAHKKPSYNVSIWFGWKNFDVDNVAKWVLDMVQCTNQYFCWKRNYLDVLDSYVPVIRNDNKVVSLHVYKDTYRNVEIPYGTIVMIELIN